MPGVVARCGGQEWWLADGQEVADWLIEWLGWMDGSMGK